MAYFARMMATNGKRAPTSRKIVSKPGPKRPHRGQFKPGNPGRPKGVITKKLLGAKQIAEEILLANDPKKYVKNIRRRILAGEAPHMETFLAQHLWGKPREQISISLTETHLLAVRTMSDLELSAFLYAMDAKKPEEALRLLPGGQVA